MNVGPTELLIVLAIVLLIFGSTRLPKLARSMGAQVQLYRECLGGTPCRFGQRNFMHSAVISGPSKLHAAELMIPDLRAGVAYLIAALAAQGTSTVHGISLINRGYEDFDEKLSALGARFEFGEYDDARSAETLARIESPTPAE